MTTYHDIRELRFENDFLVISVDGEIKKYDLRKISPILYKATEEERKCFKISPSGYGIHWPLLDEDISIDGLLGIVHTPSFKKKIA